MFIKTQLHSERYNYFLRQFLSPGIYEHFDFNLKNLFSVSTSKKLDSSGYSKFNDKKLNLDYEIFVVLGKKVVGILRIIFVQNLKETRRVKHFSRFSNSSGDLTENSTFICDDNKIIGYTKYVIKSIHVLLRSCHPLQESTQLQLLSSMRVATGDHLFSTNSFNTYMKLNFKARAKRAARFENLIKSRYIDNFKHRDEKLFLVHRHKPSKVREYFFNKFYKIKDHNDFVSSRIYRFVLHLY